MTAVASEGVPATRHRLGRALRASVLGPRGGGTTRRRASDAFRLGIAVVVVAVSIPVMRANSAVELSIVRALHPPPEAISWLVTSVFWLGSAGVGTVLVVIGLLVPRFAAVRWTALAARADLGVVRPARRPPRVGSGPTAGQRAGRAERRLSGHRDRGHDRRGRHRSALPEPPGAPAGLGPDRLAVLAAICGGQALPVNAVSSIALGWGVAAALHLAVGSPLGLPSGAEITEWITDLNVAVRDLTRSARQVWGVEQFTGRDPAGNAIELSVYGRDASDARILAKLWRFCLYRDSGPTLILDRLQQVEHEAYLTLMAGRAGVLVPDVLAAGRFGPSRDAALATQVPDSVPLAEATGDGLADGTLDEMLRAVLRLRDVGIAHGALGGDTIIVSGRGTCIRDFRRASAGAPACRLDDDMAAVLGAMAVRAGAERTAAAAVRVLDADTARGALVHLQRSALDPITVAALKHQKDLLAQLRAAVAAGTGIDVPKLAEAKRVSWANLLFAVGSLIGIWLIIGVLADAGNSLAAIKGASWGWVALTFIFAQLPMVAEACALLGAVVGDLPFGRCVALETSNSFTALVGGDVAVFALRVRFFQRQGHDAEAAVSAGAIATTASWTAKSLLFLIAIPFAAGSFHAPSSSGGSQNAVWVILVVILAAGIAAALVALVPRLRRLVSRNIRPHLVNIWANFKTIATEPRKIVYVLGGSTLAQLLVVLALGTSLHAVGQHASIATLITVNTLAAIVGGAVPVPGGLGVVEAGLIAGLTSAGIPQDQAVAAVLIQRCFTAYLPPVWGFVTLTWMRRREYV